MNMIKYSILRSDRKTLLLEVTREEWVVIKADNSISEEEINKFFLDKYSWVLKKVKEKWIVHSYINEVDYSSWSIINIFWKKVEIWESINNGKIIFKWNKVSFWEKINDDKSKKLVLVKLFREKLYSKIKKRLEIISLDTGLNCTWFSIRQYKNKWGSCSSSWHLKFNWRLAMAPVKVIDYIILHELCHTIHRTHNIDFWILLKSFMPDYEKYVKILNKKWHLWNI